MFTFEVIGTIFYRDWTRSGRVFATWDAAMAAAVEFARTTAENDSVLGIRVIALG